MRLLLKKITNNFGRTLLFALAALLTLIPMTQTSIYAAPQEFRDDVFNNRSFHDTTLLGCAVSAAGEALTNAASGAATAAAGTPGKLFIIGDSLSVGIQPKLPAELTTEEGWTVTGDTLESRSINRGGGVQTGVDAAVAKKSEIAAADYVVVVLGTNQYDASKTDIEEMVKAIQEAPSDAPIYWVTVNTAAGSGIDNEAFNTTLKTVSGINIIENTIDPPSGEYGDGVHYGVDGYASLAKVIADSVTGETPTTTGTSDTPAASGSCSCPSEAGRTEAGSPGSGQRIGYQSGLAGPYILEQFAIHSLKALAAAKGVPETDTLTREHVIAVVAFSMGEGGDIANRNIFNLLNHGKIDDDNGTLTGNGTTGFVKYSTFDDGVDANARVLNGSLQQRVATALIDPNVTAYQFMERISYWAEFPGDAAWAEASGSTDPASDYFSPNAGKHGSSVTDAYFAARKSLVDQVIADWDGTAGLQIGTDAEEQKTGAKIPSLLTAEYRPDESSGGGTPDSPGGSTGGGQACAADTAAEVTEPEIDMSKKDSFSAYADGTKKPTITPTGIVLHWTGASANDSVDKFIEACLELDCSAQFYVDGDGTIYQLVDPANTLASHAGGANECCIGIEIAGSDSSELLANTAQKQSVVNLTAHLVKQFNIQVNPDIPALKGILSHHAIPTPSNSGARSDVGDQYWVEVVASVQAAQSSGVSVPGLDETKMGWLRDSGIPESEWANVDKIIRPESGWNPEAQNPTSTAYGLAQFLKSTWAGVGCEKTPDPVEQLRCADVYVKQRYTDWAGAVEFRASNGWY